MAISYPLNTPTNIGIANITFMAENAVAISQSPFTYQQQIVAHSGQRWAASISLPPMKRQDAEYWVAFLLSLKGQVGTFLLGDPNAVDPQGTASTSDTWFLITGTWSSTGEWSDDISWITLPTGLLANLKVDGNQTSGSTTLNIKGFSAPSIGVFKAGDYIQLGSGTTATLHKILEDVDSDQSGNASFEIWPSLRRNVINNEIVIYKNAKGRFRLKDNLQQWNINEISSYGITFDCVEAI